MPRSIASNKEGISEERERREGGKEGEKGGGRERGREREREGEEGEEGRELMEMVLFDSECVRSIPL